MRLYETTFILNPQADDATFDRQIKAVSDVISRYQGKVLRENRWGIRRLSYPIKRCTQGFYTRLIFEGNQTVLSELERFYKIEEPYIRYLTVVFEGNIDEELERGRREDGSETADNRSERGIAAPEPEETAEALPKDDADTATGVAEEHDEEM
ncbi:MAG: 30S ribosomal protein S6 [bacterium]|jgi:small subunit ribosomal protein S6